jgi:hypothetical protein
MRHHFRHPQAMFNKGSLFYSHCAYFGNFLVFSSYPHHSTIPSLILQSLWNSGMMWITGKTLTNSQNRVRKKSFVGTFCFSNCHIIGLDTGGLVFLVSALLQVFLLFFKKQQNIGPKKASYVYFSQKHCVVSLTRTAAIPLLLFTN